MIWNTLSTDKKTAPFQKLMPIGQWDGRGTKREEPIGQWGERGRHRQAGEATID